MKKIEVVLILILAFLSNFIWESLHAVSFYEGYQGMEFLKYYFIMFYASFFDMIIIFLCFLFGGFIWDNFDWYKKINFIKILFIFTFLLSFATFIEVRAIFIMDRWAYNSSMPTIFGIGVSPLLQLPVCFFFSLFVLRKIKKT